ncbi:thioredoxin family protein [Brevibacillus antibioticus]|uniref:Thioredoxin family protein n=1 Tax=Brevibacillus antibioticus TaxID=2570228 RepID=A0A4U2YC93_9BACL|nr:thioredoxin family protein [Brevibacillus antibioticus]TKI58467.1 thioredoxin family protein [Brevibacillus antibioticus]
MDVSRSKQWWLWTALGIVMLAVGISAWGTASAQDVRVVYVYSDSCGYCTEFGPTFERVVKEYPSEMIQRLDIHKQKELDEASRLGAEATPTVFVVEQDKVVDKLEGAVPEHTLRSFLQRNLNQTLSKNG